MSSPERCETRGRQHGKRRCCVFLHRACGRARVSHTACNKTRLNRGGRGRDMRTIPLRPRDKEDPARWSKECLGRTRADPTTSHCITAAGEAIVAGSIVWCDTCHCQASRHDGRECKGRFWSRSCIAESVASPFALTMPCDRFSRCKISPCETDSQARSEQQCLSLLPCKKVLL